MAGSRLLWAGAMLAVVALLWTRTSRSLVKEKLDAAYDYVIVGGGSAGSVLASRLTEDKNTKVLLLEAGDEELGNPNIDVPLAAVSLRSGPLDWGYQSEPQKHACQAMNNKKCGLAAGKVLGGESSVNCMMYIRGSRHDYDQWEELGCEGWSYADVLPYFIKSETNNNQKFVESGYHGNTGPLVVSDIRPTSLPDAFVQAGMELGHKSVDVNGESQEGFMHIQGIVNKGRRWSASKAFLRPAMGRPNLHVATLAYVNKIEFDGKRAVGVEFTRNNTVQKVSARKEIILSAGTYGSAKLLLLSGVGPKKQLDKLKIPVVADLPVGENLQDHIWTDALAYTLKEPVTITEQKASSFWAFFDFFLFGTGVLSSTCGLDSVAFLPSEHQPSTAKHPYIQLQLMGLLPGSSPTHTNMSVYATNIDPQISEKLWSGLENVDGLALLPVLLHPRSHGTVTLSSSDPRDPPILQPNYLQHKEDVKVLIEAIRQGEKVMGTKMFQALGAKPLNRPHPSCQDLGYGSNEYWECYIRHNTFSMHNPVGTCRMGANTDPKAVVDSQLRVRTLQGLRVVDASIIPTITSGDTVIPTIMIAEKASDLIKGKVTVSKANVTRSA